MASPTSSQDLIDLLRKCRLFEPTDLDAYLAGPAGREESALALAERMLADGQLTKFQAGQLLKGKHRGFVLGKYKLLDRIGMGGMGQVFLAEHSSMGRRVAIKVLPPDRAKNEFAKKRFLREARATGQLDHPNIVKAFDVDSDGDVNFLVLEYVDGASFQELVSRGGPLAPDRVAHYLGQALAGLQYLHDRGFIHRDIKPANLIVDKTGMVKLLDLGLVRNESDMEDLTRKEDIKFLGTADYLAPEQAIDCKKVDGRADIYSLGATGYFLLTGAPPFAGESVAAKLIAHQTANIRPVHQVVANVPEGLSLAIARMMAKQPADRFATPAEAAAAFSTSAQTPLPPRPDELPGGKPESLSSLAANNLFPNAQIKSASPRAGNSSQTTGSGIRFYTESGGAGSGIPKPSSHALRTTPAPVSGAPAPAPAPSKPGTRLPVLPAMTSHGTTTSPTGKPMFSFKPGGAARPVPAPVALVNSPPAKPAARRRLSPRQWVAIAAGFLLTLAMTAWNTVKLRAASPPDDSQTFQLENATARR